MPVVKHDSRRPDGPRATHGRRPTPMLRDTIALAHAALLRLSADRGQGTIEYVGLMLLMSVVLAAVVSAGAGSDGKDLREMIMSKVSGAIDSVGEPGKK